MKGDWDAVLQASSRTGTIPFRRDTRTLRSDPCAFVFAYNVYMWPFYCVWCSRPADMLIGEVGV